MLSWLLGSLLLGGMTLKPIELSDLPRHESFPVTVSGPLHTGECSNMPCVYSEWVKGEKNELGWVQFQSGASPQSELQVQTPTGVLTLHPVRLRLYLAPSCSKSLDPPQVVEEYCLEPKRTYYAQIEVESYYLPPPGPDEPPVRQHNTVLGISDQPWQDGRPSRPLTPRGRQHTY